MAEFYKHEIAKWNVATDDLTLEQEAAYHRVVAMIRLYERPFRHNLRVLSGMWRCNERRAKRLLEELIDAGKLTIEGGLIIDEKAVDDASTLRQSRVDKSSAGRLGGVESGKSRRKSLENKDAGEAHASTREDKRRKENKDGCSVDAQAREPILIRVFTALGFDPASPPKPWRTSATHVLGWQIVHGLADEELVKAVEVFASINAAPIAGPAALDPHIAAFAKAKAKRAAVASPPTTPAPPDPKLPTFRDELLAAMGVDHPSGLTGHGGTRIGTQADMALANQWLALPGITPQIVCAEVARITAEKDDGPPNGFKYFTKAMQRLSGQLTAPPLQPTPAKSPNPRGNRHDRTEFDRTISAVADKLASGEITLDTSSRNPFAALPR